MKNTISMHWKETIQMVQVHCQGEIGKVIFAGAPEIPGKTVADKMDYINNVDDSLRRFVTLEPRACVQMSVNLLMPPTREDADAAFIVLQADRAHPMSGSNCICVVTALLEAGLVPMVEPQTVVRLDTAAGLITVKARCENGRCLSVSLDNVPAFVEQLGCLIDTPSSGALKVDVAFGGVYYAVVDSRQLNLSIVPASTRQLAEAGIRLLDLMADAISVRHPEVPSIDSIAYVMFTEPNADGSFRTCTTLRPGRVDRSPCGTGSSAMLAILHASGLIQAGDTRVSNSIIGGKFEARVRGITTVGGRAAVMPTITGEGWVYGTESLRVDRDDPFAEGFALSDAWGPDVGERPAVPS